MLTLKPGKECLSGQSSNPKNQGSDNLTATATATATNTPNQFSTIPQISAKI
jgi:hypothetical protein